MPTTVTVSNELFLGRQPILDDAQQLVGYELLFRHNRGPSADIADDWRATAEVLCNAFAELGMASALGNRLAFINVSSDFLTSDTVELLPAKSVVLELGAQSVESPDILVRCRELRTKGYSFCLQGDSNVILRAKALAGVADYLKIEGDTAVGHPEWMPSIRESSFRLIATRVETQEAMRNTARLGFRYFQGYYFARPVTIEGRGLDPSLKGILHLINLVSEDASASDLETAFKTEPALTINLLRLVNSVGAGLANRINSVRHAITALGRRQLLRWLQLLVFAQRGSHQGLSHNPLMQLAALRACFMEKLAQVAFPGRAALAEQAFLAGLMSLMPSALQVPMTVILSQITVAPELRRALARREGELGTLLALTEGYDDNNMELTAELLRGLPSKTTAADLARCLTEAIAWVQQLDSPGA